MAQFELIFVHRHDLLFFRRTTGYSRRNCRPETPYWQEKGQENWYKAASITYYQCAFERRYRSYQRLCRTGLFEKIVVLAFVLHLTFTFTLPLDANILYTVYVWYRSKYNIVQVLGNAKKVKLTSSVISMILETRAFRLQLCVPNLL